MAWTPLLVFIKNLASQRAFSPFRIVVLTSLSNVMLPAKRVKLIPLT